MKKCYVVEVVDGIAINVVEAENPEAAAGVFEQIVRENMEQDETELDDLHEIVNTGIYANGDYTASILILE